MPDPNLITKTASAYSYPLLIKQLLHTPINLAPDQEIVYRDLMRYTYRDMYKRINKLANALTDLGVKPGDTVAVLEWDSHRYLECFFAVPMLGAVLHTVNIRLSPEQILYTMNHAEDDVVLINEEFLPLMEEIAGRLQTVKKFVLLKDDYHTPATSLDIAAEYEQMLEPAADEFEFPDFDENTQATIFYTTGTTGSPKGVYFSHRQLVLHTLSTGWVLGGMQPSALSSIDVYMPVTPLFHVHAWGMPLVAAGLGVKQVYPGRYEPEMLLKLVDQEEVTFSHCVPTILHMILSDPLAEEMDLRGWKVNIGGAALPRGLAKRAHELGLEVFQGYGMSETCPVLTVATLKPHMLDWDRDAKLDYQLKAGFPIPLVDLRTVSPDGAPLPRDGKSAGEVVVRSPWLTQGYYKEEKRSEELWEGGWLHTGDVGVLDEEGYLQITDRIKDVIKSGGEWISSLALEDLISQHEAVAEAAVVGVPDERWGERPLAMVVLGQTASGQVSAEEITDFLGAFVDDGTISKWAAPEIMLVEEIPKTSVGKLDKKEIRKQLAEGG